MRVLEQEKSVQIRIYSVGQKVCLSFSITAYAKTWMNFLDDKIHKKNRLESTKIKLYLF